MENNTEKKWGKLFSKQKSKSENDNKSSNPEKITSYMFIFDCEENVIIFTNKSFEIVTGHESEAFTIDFLLKSIHPDDLDYFLACEEKNLKFTNTLLFGEHFKYMLSYTYRVRTASGEYIRVMQECQALEVNSSGHLIKTLVIHKKIEYSEKTPENDLRVFDKSQGIYVDMENSYNLSKREFQILNLIKEGHNSQEVADKLNLSKNTVLTHRKNILNKTKSSSFIELVKKLSYSHYQ